MSKIEISKISAHAVLAASLLSLTIVQASAQVQDQDAELRNPTVVVTSTREEQAEAFVSQVQPDGWAAAKRGVPRWDSDVCISVIGPSADQGQIMVDRISHHAISAGLGAGGAGCDTNVLVIATNEPNALLAALEKEQRGLFGFAGDANIDTGGSDSSFSAFLTSGLPVRWRYVIKTIGANGESLDGEARANAFDKSRESDPRWTNSFSDLPVTRVESTRLRSTIRRSLSQVTVVIDTNQTRGLSLTQVSDYLAFVILADVDPEADLSGFPSILNLFNPQAEQVTEMSEWDEAFLASLYSAKLDGASGTMQYREIASRLADYGQD